jgi:hypothetical protein
MVNKSLSSPLIGQGSLNEKITVSFSGETLGQVLDYLSKEFKIKFTYNSRELDLNQRVYFKAF